MTFNLESIPKVSKEPHPHEERLDKPLSPSFPSRKKSVKCFKCLKHDHVTNQCPNKHVLTLGEMEEIEPTTMTPTIESEPSSSEYSSCTPLKKEPSSPWSQISKETLIELKLIQPPQKQGPNQEDESFPLPLTCMTEAKSMKEDYTTENGYPRLHHNSTFSLGQLTKPSPFVLMPKEDLHIKEQWDKQWGEEKMINKEETSLENFEHIPIAMMVKTCNEHIPKHCCPSMNYIRSPICRNREIVLKLLDDFCRFVFDPGGPWPAT